MLSANEVTVQQAAEILHVAPEEIEQLIRRRLLPSYLHIAPDGSRHRVIPRNVCLQLAKSGRAAVTPEAISEPPPVGTAPAAPPQIADDSDIPGAVFSETSRTPSTDSPREEHDPAPVSTGSTGTSDAASRAKSPLERLATGISARSKRDQSEVAQHVHDGLGTLAEQVRTIEDRLRVAEEEMGTILQDARTLLTAMKIQIMEMRGLCDKVTQRLKAGARSQETCAD